MLNNSLRRCQYFGSLTSPKTELRISWNEVSHLNAESLEVGVFLASTDLCYNTYKIIVSSMDFRVDAECRCRMKMKFITTNTNECLLCNGSNILYFNMQYI